MNVVWPHTYKYDSPIFPSETSDTCSNEKITGKASKSFIILFLSPLVVANRVIKHIA
jgi:hypothetical protein